MEQSSVIMYSADWCADCRRSKRLMDELNVAYTLIDVEFDTAAADKVREINSGIHRIPVIIFEDGTHLTEPSDIELKTKLSVLGII